MEALLAKLQSHKKSSMAGSGMPSKAAAGLKAYRAFYKKARNAGHSPAQSKALWKQHKKGKGTKKKATKKKATKKTTKKRRGRGLVGGEEQMMAKLMAKLMNA